MRKWIDSYANGSMIVVNFQPDSTEENLELEKLLGFRLRDKSPIPIGNERDKKIGEGAEEVGEIRVHETQYSIRIDLEKLRSLPKP